MLDSHSSFSLVSLVFLPFLSPFLACFPYAQDFLGSKCRSSPGIVKVEAKSGAPFRTGRSGLVTCSFRALLSVFQLLRLCNYGLVKELEPLTLDRN